MRIEEERQEQIDAETERNLLRTAFELRGQLEDCKFHCEVYRSERDRAREHYENTVKILMRIHNLLYPPAFHADGKTYLFNSPYKHEQMQALSDAIRAIPDELAKASNPFVRRDGPL